MDDFPAIFDEIGGSRCIYYIPLHHQHIISHHIIFYIIYHISQVIYHTYLISDISVTGRWLSYFFLFFQKIDKERLKQKRRQLRQTKNANNSKILAFDSTSHVIDFIDHDYIHIFTHIDKVILTPISHH